MVWEHIRLITTVHGANVWSSLRRHVRVRRHVHCISRHVIVLAISIKPSSYYYLILHIWRYIQNSKNFHYILRFTKTICLYVVLNQHDNSFEEITFYLYGKNVFYNRQKCPYDNIEHFWKPTVYIYLRLTAWGMKIHIIHMYMYICMCG